MFREFWESNEVLYGSTTMVTFICARTQSANVYQLQKYASITKRDWHWVALIRVIKLQRKLLYAPSSRFVIFNSYKQFTQSLTTDILAPLCRINFN